eukprot:CCRYP_011785-RA/>CCRYP_011785-RA protein AED:0.40 eAED:0.40 QI:0/0/0/1/1/1/2/0/342
MSPIPGWSAKSAHKKLTLTAQASPLAATASGIQVTVGPKRAPWKPSNNCSIAFFPRLPHALHRSISLTSTLAHHSTDQSMPASSSPIFLTTLSKSIASTTLRTIVLFVLIVDDFGIQYSDRRHAEHLLQALQQHYTITTDWTGTKFSGIDIKWDYNKRTCRLTMDTYISALLLKYDHPQPHKPQHAPHKQREIIYGTKEQLLPDKDTSPPLDAAGIKRIQDIVGSILYYARAVDNKLLVALSTISSQQTAATQNTAAAVHQLLDYVATYPKDGITYHASSMILAAHSDASYLTEPGSRSRAGAHIFLSEDDPVPRHKMPVLTISQIIKYVMASAAEAELAAS